MNRNFRDFQFNSEGVDSAFAVYTCLERDTKFFFPGSIISRTDRKSFYRSLLSMKKQNIQKLR
ncbi:hypothetical protein FVD62_12890 [Enterococcus faecium]|nr:hypothetical protein [Enterococcus faecium]